MGEGWFCPDFLQNIFVLYHSDMLGRMKKPYGITKMDILKPNLTLPDRFLCLGKGREGLGMFREG